MSSALAIAGVTAVLRDRLTDWLVDQDVASLIGSTVGVSVLSPDRVVPEGGTEASQLNLFLYNVSRNLGWANTNLPSHDPTGRFRLSNAPLGLDLHYLVSAYSGSDLHAEILLGYAVQLMHEVPVLTREMIRSALNPAENPDLPPALSALSESGLADQVEQLRITPQYLDHDAISKIWTALQASYRPSAAYDVSVVLIQNTRRLRPGLPVLTRDITVSPSLIPPLPTIEKVEPANTQPAAVLDTVVTLRGHHLGGGGREVVLLNERFEVVETLAASGASVDDQLTFTIPLARAADFPVGVYSLTARLIRTGETDPRETNRVAMVLAPEITNLPQNVPRTGQDASFTLDFTPMLRPGQQVVLALGEGEYVPEDFTPPVSSLTFLIPDAPVGSFLARLRIDGIESAIIDRSVSPPVFLPMRVVIT